MSGPTTIYTEISCIKWILKLWMTFTKTTQNMRIQGLDIG